MPLHYYRLNFPTPLRARILARAPARAPVQVRLLVALAPLLLLLVLLQTNNTWASPRLTLDDLGAGPAQQPGFAVGLTGKVSEERLDINSASVELLASTLPGIGPAKAQRIVDWREQNGRFTRLEQLLEISGIGEKTLQRIRPFIYIADPRASRAIRRRAEQREAVVRRAVQAIVRTANRDAAGGEQRLR